MFQLPHQQQSLHIINMPKACPYAMMIVLLNIKIHASSGFQLIQKQSQNSFTLSKQQKYKNKS